MGRTGQDTSPTRKRWQGLGIEAIKDTYLGGGSKGGRKVIYCHHQTGVLQSVIRASMPIVTHYFSTKAVPGPFVWGQRAKGLEAERATRWSPASIQVVVQAIQATKHPSTQASSLRSALAKPSQARVCQLQLLEYRTIATASFFFLCAPYAS